MTPELTSPAKTVLVVEDTGSCATTLEIALAIAGLGVMLAGSAEEAHKILEADGAVCAVVTDVHLPEASGLDLIEWVRARKGRAMPIVVISGDSDPETPAASLRLGADAYFSKPFSPNEVRQKLEELIHAESSAPPVR
jgi:DNA-binding response OmpR family regulator